MGPTPGEGGKGSIVFINVFVPLAQVQKVVDDLLRAPQLARSCFFGQHMGGGLLDKTDGTLKVRGRVARGWRCVFGGVAYSGGETGGRWAG